MAGPAPERPRLSPAEVENFRPSLVPGRAAALAVVLLTLALAAFFARHVPEFTLDATTDSIVLEDDAALRYYDASRLLFGTDDYAVVIVNAPSREALFSDRGLALVRELRDGLKEIPRIEGVMSILDVPLFHSPDVPLAMLAKGYKTLEAGADRTLAPDELTSSPLYSNYLVSPDGETTSIQINFDPDREFLKLGARRRELLNRRESGEISPEERAEFRKLDRQYSRRHAEVSAERREDIRHVRELCRSVEKKYPEFGRIQLGGVPMMIVDMINYVERDIWVFGAAVVALMATVLAFVYRAFKWVFVPMTVCLAAGCFMIGFLGWSGWLTTVVTSNFTSLLLILTLSTSIHLVERHRELHALHPDWSNGEITVRAVRLVFAPCLVMVFTTGAGFASLVMSGIRPVMDFGWMMSMGLTVSLVLCFVLLPALLILAGGDPEPPVSLSDRAPSKIMPLAVLTGRHPVAVGAAATAVFLALCAGAARLSVESRFIDYFRPGAPIHESITTLDQKIGGAMPLEVVLDGKAKDFWLDPANLDELDKIHRYIDGLDETAKVLSPSSMRAVLTRVNKGKPVPKPMIKMALASIPDAFKPYIVTPYITADYSQVRIMIRVRDSDRGLKREALRKTLEDYLNQSGWKVGERAHVTGYFILYANMIASLFASQIKTVGSVLAVCFISFLIAFRSVRLAMVALLPNVFAVAAVLGMMGWLGVRLDMMTIMIAAVTFGMADDAAIHYLHRFREEFPRDRDYLKAMYRCHNSIGRPLSTTMVATVAGFSILGFSEFVPTRYFGLFTGLAMFVAVIAAHTVLPMLVILVKPFGPGAGTGAGGGEEPAAAPAAEPPSAG